MAETRAAENQKDALKQHRRETWLQIFLPVGIGVVVIAICLLFAILLPRLKQVSAVADFMVTLLMLCPLAICLLPAALGLVAAVAAMNSVHDKASGALGRVVSVSEKITNRFDSSANSVAHRAINASARLAPIEKKLFGAFDPPQAFSSKEVTHVPTPPRQPPTE